MIKKSQQVLKLEQEIILLEHMLFIRDKFSEEFLTKLYRVVFIIKKQLDSQSSKQNLYKTLHNLGFFPKRYDTFREFIKRGVTNGFLKEESGYRYKDKGKRKKCQGGKMRVISINERFFKKELCVTSDAFLRLWQCYTFAQKKRLPILDVSYS